MKDVTDEESARQFRKLANSICPPDGPPPPAEMELEAVGRDESCHNCGEARADGTCDYFMKCTLDESKWRPKP